MGTNQMLTDIITVKTHEKLLRTPSRTTTVEEVKELRLEQILPATVNRGWTPGVGISAIQVGIPVKFGYYQYNKKRVFLLNPRILKRSNPTRFQSEGCLSVPNCRFTTTRFREITFWNDWDKEEHTVYEFEAFIVQHETDHMDGKLVDQSTKKIGRNDKCICGSDKKFKRCCGA